MLTGVTISGADDAVDPAQLRALSERFPFVEWGILLSFSRRGEARYPTEEWIERLPRMRSALHLCGAPARLALSGSTVGIDLPQRFRRVSRVQVNGYAPPSPGLVHVANCWTGFRFVLQVRREEDLHAAAADVAQIHHRRGAILFDPSGGRGERPAAWPLPPEGVPMGYAGGITPDNVVETLDAIGYIAAPFWIDMESGVRTDDWFDLSKVGEVLERCAPHVRPQ